MTNPSKPRVLVVDDEGADTYVDLLQENGFEAESVDGIDAAKVRLKANAYDAVLLDMRMPNPRGDVLDAGLVVLKDIARYRPGTTVIILTGYGTGPNTLAALELGASAYLKRGIPGVVAGFVRDVLKRRFQATMGASDEVLRQINEARLTQLRGFPSDQDIESGLSVAGGNIRAICASGDFFDHVYVAERRELWFLLGDVCDHGLGQAMVGAHLGRVFRIGVELGWPLNEIDARLDRTAKEVLIDDRPFVTGIVGVLQIPKNLVTMIVAGHDAPSLDGSGKSAVVAGLSSGGAWGLRSSSPIDPNAVSFGPGQSLVFHTDGIKEMRDHKNEAFGLARLEDAHAGFSVDTSRFPKANPAKQLCEHILYRAIEFGGKDPTLGGDALILSPKDDLTVLAIHWSRSPGFGSVPG